MDFILRGPRARGGADSDRPSAGTGRAAAAARATHARLAASPARRRADRTTSLHDGDAGHREVGLRALGQLGPFDAFLFQGSIAFWRLELGEGEIP
ncbi:MAG: hypothetical protein P8Y71_13465 [Pseudolabrys sp.]|jgi:hypothetical protein